MKRVSLTAWIFIAMLAGVAVGAAYPEVAKAEWMASLANVFLRLIKSIVAPLIFGTLVYGIAGTGSVKTMGRIGLKAIIYFEVLTTIALFLGLGAVNLVRPGEGMRLERTAAETGLVQTAPSLSSTLEHTFPASVIDAMARGDVLQIVVFSFLFGAACAAIGAKARAVVDFCKSLSEVMFRYTRYVMYLAPLGVGAAMAHTIGSNGMGVLLGLGKLVLTLYGALVVFIVVVLGAVALIARVPVRPFFRAVREPFIVAFSTASSEAALPLALENLELMGVPPHIVAFVLPTGYSFNLDGSTMYLSLASLFVAQAAGVHMPFSQQLLMMLTLMLTSKGVAAVPRAALVILAGTLTTFGLPLSGVALILGADALMDMARTSVNLLGNCMATAVVARWEGVDLEAATPDAAPAADPPALHAAQAGSRRAD
ncbi:MAG TPA: dicarboxylate/amino acid:cation symporter [Bryobacteraceae bacterium]|nr:dicarboxylate/amino acid:cation symporter [Bryobacteraceae bacterium]